MISFNVPPCTGNEMKYIGEAVAAHKICGDGQFTKRCNAWLEERFHANKVMLTTSGSTALDMAFELCELRPGDEVILPSYTFSSTANAAVLCGARLVFTDIRPDTMNIDEKKIEQAISDRTKVICCVHYAGVACEMDTIMDIAHRHGLRVIEDAAQGVMSTYKGRALGTIGDFGCYSFHETKNYSMGEGGAIVINNPEFNEKAEVLREKGTNRSKFFRGQVDKYTWVDFGDSYLPSELNAAYLWAQLEVLHQGKGSAREDCPHQLPQDTERKCGVPLRASPLRSCRLQVRKVCGRRRVHHEGKRETAEASDVLRAQERGSTARHRVCKGIL